MTSSWLLSGGLLLVSGRQIKLDNSHVQGVINSSKMTHSARQFQARIRKLSLLRIL